MSRFLTAAVVCTAILLLCPGTASAVGVFSVSPLTGDADSGILPNSPFALAIDVDDNGNRTVNGAVFTGSGVGSITPSTNNYSTGGASNSFTGNASTVTGDVGGLMTNFLFGGNPQTLTLNNLRIGETYETTFYNSTFGGTRLANITASDGGVLNGYDQQNNLLKYNFVATANTQTYTITPTDGGATYHFYAFSNALPDYAALLTDNFDVSGTPDTNNLNFNLEARQGGNLAAGANTVLYTKIGPNGQVGNPTGGIDNGNYYLSAASTKMSPVHNFNNTYSEGGLLIAFDMAPNVGSNGDTSVWAALNLGMAGADRGADVNGGQEHFGILFRGNGQIQAFDGGAVVSGAETWTAQTNVTSQLHRIELLLSDPTDDNPFDNVGQTKIDVYADGQFVYTYTKGGGGYDQNFISLQGFAIGGFDNLLIAQAQPIPEPSTLCLATIGLAGLGLAVRRRRGR